MAERTFNSDSTACGQWEMLLAEALDGLLKPGDEAIFNAHKAVCPACAALYEEARQGREWLEFLSPEPETPAGLLDKILARTGPGQAANHGLLATAGGNVVSVPAWQRPGLMAQLRRFAEPRLMMTAAMAFFSIALTINMTGVRLSSVQLSELRPGAVRSFMERRLTTASTPIIRYYDNSRLAYEVQTTMRELRQSTESESNRQKPEEPAPGESKQTPGTGDGGQQAAPPRQPGSLATGPAVEPTSNDSRFLKTTLTFQQQPFTPAAKTCRRAPGSALPGGLPRERNTRWTA